MRPRLLLVILLFAAAPAALLFLRPSTEPPPAAQAVADDVETDPTGTFSILGFDPATGEVGGAVQSRVFAVGNGVLWAEAEVGVVATQAIVDVSYGPKGLELLRQGLSPKDVITRILAEDPDAGYGTQRWPKAGRQVAVMNAKGELAAHTGPEASSWAGDRQGTFVTAQGNILAGEAVVTNMVAAFEKTEQNEDGTRNHLALRLVAALEAGQAAGGDTRGQQSAAILIVKKGCGVWLNNDVVLRLQVDNDAEPIKKLRENVEYWWTRQRRQRPTCPQR